MRITGVVRATFHQFLGERLGYIDVALPGGWKVYRISYAGEKNVIVDVVRV